MFQCKVKLPFSEANLQLSHTRSWQCATEHKFRLEVYAQGNNKATRKVIKPLLERRFKGTG